ncbi:ethanolamine ammonia-lyase subunit EutC [Mucilaginibacter sp. UR6-1]|uniref:ethanolamine ammonia-lyase subunit EutC n=1 Tax=Mucilaginibacter sp. UR6-1 TaxID=1435643 RepID=UPI001E61F528|nr:ethanolamine ammonia-lyase subunit EutC [Mucilaginibacter sp. UR6-1]MCC8407968.1 ethanolamine ammonia-lyase subunit EutC [Mucilaginibacter sp. UR6-1]
MSDELDKRSLWDKLKEYTSARIAIGRTGNSIPVQNSLEFKLAHAHARDAVYSKLDVEKLHHELEKHGLPIINLKSKADYREQYLQRPDLGRKIDDDAYKLLEPHKGNYDIAIIIADGLSATAINQNTSPLLDVLIPAFALAKYSLAPLCLIEQGRVAIGDDVGSILNAKLSLILIGERPGLSAADSMGAYLTYLPKPGLTDESRNCISNIRPQGLPVHLAAEKIFYLIQQSLRRQLSGVQLKDDADEKYFP